jgi:hypothetical protein
LDTKVEVSEIHDPRMPTMVLTITSAFQVEEIGQNLKHINKENNSCTHKPKWISMCV